MKKLKVIRYLLVFLLISCTPTISAEESLSEYWAKSFGTTYIDKANLVGILPDGDIIISGITQYNPEIELQIPESRSVLLRLSPTGKVKWAKVILTAFSLDAMKIDEQGNILVAGQLTNNNILLLAKLDKDGNVIWERYMRFNESVKISSLLLIQNNIVAVGIIGYPSFWEGNSDVLVLKLDHEGNVIWAKKFGGTKNEINIKAILNDDSTIYVAGTTLSIRENRDIFVAKLSLEDGNVIWIRGYGSTSNEDLSYLGHLGDNKILFAGITTSYDVEGTPFILITDEGGDIQFQGYYGIYDNYRASTLGAEVVMANKSLVISVDRKVGWPQLQDSVIFHISISDFTKIDWAFKTTEFIGIHDVKLSKNNMLILVGEYFKDKEDPDIWVMKHPLNDVLPDCEFCTNIVIKPLLIKDMSRIYYVPMSLSDVQFEIANYTLSIVDITSRLNVSTYYPPYGILRIRSEPSTAKVYINGSFVGYTPLTIIN